MQAVYFLIRPGPGALIKPLKQAGKRSTVRADPLPFLRLARATFHIYTSERGAAVLGFLINERSRRRTRSVHITGRGNDALTIIITMMINDGIIRSIRIIVVDALSRIITVTSSLYIPSYITLQSAKRRDVTGRRGKETLSLEPPRRNPRPHPPITHRLISRPGPATLGRVYAVSTTSQSSFAPLSRPPYIPWTAGLSDAE